jgi:Carbonic anhydrase
MLYNVGNPRHRTPRTSEWEIPQIPVEHRNRNKIVVALFALQPHSSVQALGVNHVLVCGHENCGAVAAALTMPSSNAMLTNCWISQIRVIRNEHAVDLDGKALPEQVCRSPGHICHMRGEKSCLAPVGVDLDCAHRCRCPNLHVSTWDSSSIRAEAALTAKRLWPLVNMHAGRRPTRCALAAHVHACMQVSSLVRFNVFRQVFNVMTSPVIQQAWEEGREVYVHGLVYNVATGELQQVAGPFSATDEVPLEAAEMEELAECQHDKHLHPTDDSSSPDLVAQQLQRHHKFNR